MRGIEANASNPIRHKYFKYKVYVNEYEID